MVEAFVQPLTIPAPSVWASEPELIQYHDALVRQFEQLFEEVFWVNTKASGNTTSASRNHARIRREHIFATGSGAKTIFLHDGSDFNEPREDDEVMVTMHGTGPVRVDFGTKTYYGQGFVDLSHTDSPNFKWSDIVNEWVAF